MSGYNHSEWVGMLRFRHTMIAKKYILEIVSNISGNTYIVSGFAIFCDGNHAFAY